MELSLVIPTYRETDRLRQTLIEIQPYLTTKFQNFEILIVDDPDATGGYTQVQAPFATDPRIKIIKQEHRLGKGAAVRRGCMAAQYDIVLFMDADHATPIEEFNQFLPLLTTGEECMVAGVRTYQENENKWRRILGMSAMIFLHIVFFKKVVLDSQCGFKAFRRSLIQKVFPLLQVQGGMIDAEIFYLLQKFGFTTYYRPVHWANKDGTRINIWRCLWNDPLEIFKVLVRDALGKYRLAKD
jgi:dolichyl-phosphate beta-glucosyltransferase